MPRRVLFAAVRALYSIGQRLHAPSRTRNNDNPKAKGFGTATGKASSAAKQAAPKEQPPQARYDEHFDSGNAAATCIVSTSPHNSNVGPAALESRPTSSHTAPLYNNSGPMVCDAANMGQPSDRSSSSVPSETLPLTAEETWYWDGIPDFGEHLNGSDIVQICS
ncbi:hypothetical protein VP1G_11458 [Cytospora mali]|uniref:Uncharacterized protein n=1 Tax=Cytospora mali TaxID=578113 RepID=A0A194VG89_CYTMA|nr:hypothetical protein VP1G_11458 [Valsa mali var. pyri (nom. inval.)]